jgi:rare lipoprotein A (peptidoglycan hydrolase)
MIVDFGRAARGMACFVSAGLVAGCFYAGAAAAAEDVPPGVFFSQDRGQVDLTPHTTSTTAPGAAARTPVAHAPIGRAAGSLVRASWYGGGEKLSKHTASGQRFNPWGMTAAHRTLPLGTRLQVTLGGRTIVVTVTDRGPAKSTGRGLDLSRGAARALGFEKAGQASLTMAVLS